LSVKLKYEFSRLDGFGGRAAAFDGFVVGLFEAAAGYDFNRLTGSRRGDQPARIRFD
jgi:hypothetical protein